MTSRMFAASIITLGIGAMFAPVETSAGSGGFIAAPSLAARGAPPVARTFPPHRIIGAFPTHRRGSGFLPGWGYASSVPSYYPPEYTAPYGTFPYAYPPTENFSERSRPVAAHPPECHTDTQKVPSETGGERTINITRCY